MSLPKPGDPFVAPGGVVVWDDTTKEGRRSTLTEYQERRSIPLLTSFAPAEAADIASLPEEDEKQQAAMAAIVALRMMGLDFDDIASMLGVKTDTIKEMLQTEAMQTTFERVFRGVINVNADTVHGRVGAYADNALNVMLQLMNDEETRDDVRFKSAQDVLDRSGTNAEQFFGAKDKGVARDDELRIVMMDEGGEQEKVSVTLKRR